MRGVELCINITFDLRGARNRKSTRLLRVLDADAAAARKDERIIIIIGFYRHFNLSGEFIIPSFARITNFRFSIFLYEDVSICVGYIYIVGRAAHLCGHRGRPNGQSSSSVRRFISVVAAVRVSSVGCDKPLSLNVQ